MWFKNLIIYKLPADWSWTAAALEDQLSRRTLLPCGPYDMQSRGWVPPGPHERLTHTINRQHLIALGVDEKLLPASIIRQETLQRAKEIAQEQGYPVGRRQMRELKERVTEQLRARALTRRKITRAWIDPQHGWFVVDAAGAPRAEQLVETLRDTLGSFAATPLETERSPQMSMVAWLTLGDAPARFAIDQDLELQAADKTKATVRYSRHPLETKEIQAHIHAGKYATRLGLTWADRVSLVLTDKLQLKRVQFLEMTKDSSDHDEQSAEEQFDVDFALMSGEFAQLLADLEAALGVEQRRAAA